MPQEPDDLAPALGGDAAPPPGPRTRRKASVARLKGVRPPLLSGGLLLSGATPPMAPALNWAWPVEPPPTLNLPMLHQRPGGRPYWDEGQQEALIHNGVEVFRRLSVGQRADLRRLAIECSDIPTRDQILEMLDRAEVSLDPVQPNAAGLYTLITPEGVRLVDRAGNVYGAPPAPGPNRAERRRKKRGR